MSLLSFNDYNNLDESYSDFEYNTGEDVIFELLNVINEYGTLSETEVYTFLDTILEETGWDLNDEVYETYYSWLADYSSLIDEGINESEDEIIFALTNRGEMVLEGFFGDKFGKITGAAKAMSAGGKDRIQRGDVWREKKNLGKLGTIGKATQYIKGATKANLGTIGGKDGKGGFQVKGKHAMIGAGLGIGALGAGAYALKRRHDKKKMAMQQPQQQQPMNSYNNMR